jgi:predicted amidohydrolase YtcJ
MFQVRSVKVFFDGAPGSRGAAPFEPYDAGGVLRLGSDFGIYSHNPLTGTYAAITRQNEDGTPPEGFYADEEMTREEAIRGYTIWPAYAAFL